MIFWETLTDFKSEEKHWALFSYDKRDPLSHQAKVEYVYPEQDMRDVD